MKIKVKCKKCGTEVSVYRNPFPTVDIIIHQNYSQVVLVKRKNPPLGWALPGGFVDYGESLEEAAIREAKEETSIDIKLEALLGVYSHPSRDPRHHTISVVFVATAEDFTKLRGGDDAKEAKLFALNDLPQLAFDHFDILQDFISLVKGETKRFINTGRSICGGIRCIDVLTQEVIK